MFGLFKKPLSISEYGKTAEILPVAENGDYKAFLIQVLDKSSNFNNAIKNAGGGEVALGLFVDVIDRRISRGDFENIFDVVDRMFEDYGDTPPIRNPNVERVVICKGEEGYIFKWSP